MRHKEKKDRRQFLSQSLLAVGGIVTVGSCSKAIGGIINSLGPTLPNGRGHTMLIVGTKSTFLSHQPMFGTRGLNSPYRYQVILEADFGKSQTAYEKARANDQGIARKVLYTFDPEEFELSELNRRTAPRTQINGTIYRGPVDEVAEPVADALRTRVKKIYFQEFNSRTKKPAQLQYMMFGKTPEIFLAHLITRAPDFDHIVSLKAVDTSSFAGDTFSQELSRGLKIFLKLPNSIASRPSPKSGLLDAEAESSISRRRLPIRFEVESELYLEEGQLRTPPQYATTTAEETAGFP